MGTDQTRMDLLAHGETTPRGGPLRNCRKRTQATGMKVGMFVNLGRERVEYKRIVF
jgi:hypothetical protein